MNWEWATSLDPIWRSPAFPMWLTLAAAGFFGLIVLITLLRAEKSVANGALTVITLLAIGVAVAATIRSYGPSGHSSPSEARPQAMATAALPALSCIDDLAGDIVLSACEKALFGSPEAAAAAVTYTAAQITRLTALGDATAANRQMTPDVRALRRALERDRYGLVAQVLLTRDNCTPADCAAFRSLTDRQQIVSNMDAHLYDGLVARYAPSWNAPALPGPLAGLPPSVPTGRPTNAEFPSAASTPAVSIMTPEPTGGSNAAAAARQAPPSGAAAPTSAPRPAAATSAQASAPAPAARKPPAPKAVHPPAAAAPVQIAPPASAPAPAAANNE
jgi:hypothetical protein